MRFTPENTYVDILNDEAFAFAIEKILISFFDSYVSARYLEWRSSCALEFAFTDHLTKIIDTENGILWVGTSVLEKVELNLNPPQKTVWLVNEPKGNKFIESSFRSSRGKFRLNGKVTLNC